MSLLINRVSGQGSVNIGLDNVFFGINEDGHYYLGDQVGPEASYNSVTHMRLSIGLIEDQTDRVLLEIEQDGSISSLSIANELDPRLESLDFILQSSDEFIPMIHFIDEIMITCDGDAIESSRDHEEVHNAKSQLKRSVHQSASSVLIWPNPVQEDYIDAVLLNPQEQNPYILLAPDGYAIAKGKLSSGFNRIVVDGLRSGIYYLVMPKIDGTKEVERVVITK